MNYKVKTELKDYQNATVDWMIDHESKYGGGMILSDRSGLKKFPFT